MTVKEFHYRVTLKDDFSKLLLKANKGILITTLDATYHIVNGTMVLLQEQFSQKLISSNGPVNYKTRFNLIQK